MQREERTPLFKSDLIKPAAEAVPEGSEGEAKDRAWLRNLVCGFDMEIPAERLQQETVGEQGFKLFCTRHRSVACTNRSAVLMWTFCQAAGTGDTFQMEAACKVQACKCPGLFSLTQSSRLFYMARTI